MCLHLSLKKKEQSQKVMINKIIERKIVNVLLSISYITCFRCSKNRLIETVERLENQLLTTHSFLTHLIGVSVVFTYAR